jgi:hypothetical protein
VGLILACNPGSLATVSDDPEDDMRSFRALIEANVRGWNPYWSWRDKPIRERNAARKILEGAGVRVVDLVSRERGQDPPDCGQLTR